MKNVSKRAAQKNNKKNVKTHQKKLVKNVVSSIGDPYFPGKTCVHKKTYVKNDTAETHRAPNTVFYLSKRADIRVKMGVFPAFLRFDTQKTTSRFAPLCFWVFFLHFYTVFTSLLNCTHVLTRKKRAHGKPRRAPGAKMLQSGSRELPCALAFSLVKNDDQGPKARRSISACRFLRVKTCVRHEKHVKTV